MRVCACCVYAGKCACLLFICLYRCFLSLRPGVYAYVVMCGVAYISSPDQTKVRPDKVISVTLRGLDMDYWKEHSQQRLGSGFAWFFRC